MMAMMNLMKEILTSTGIKETCKRVDNKREIKTMDMEDTRKAIQM